MHTYIKKLQSKSEDSRKQILLASIIVSMSIVGFVWIYNLSDHFSEKTGDQASDSLKPFSLFANSVSNLYKNMSASAGSTTSTSTEKDKTSEKQIELIPVESRQNQ